MTVTSYDPFEGKGSKKKTDKKKRKKKREKRPPKKITPKYLKNYTAFYLKRYTTTTMHLKKLLMRRAKRSIAFHGEPEITEAEMMIDDLIRMLSDDMGLIDDERYAESKALSQRRKGQSRRAIVGKLMQKGLDPDAAHRAISSVDQQMPGRPMTDADQKWHAELKAARRYMARRRITPWGPAEKKADYDAYEKDLARLARRGFSYDIVKTALELSDGEIKDGEVSDEE